MSKSQEIRVPNLGDFDAVPVIGILVKPGDVVAVDDSLIELESDKATMEVPAPQAGTIEEIRVKEGDTLSQGDVILTILDGAVAAEETPAPQPEPAAASEPVSQAPAPLPTASETVSDLPYAGPSVRKFARDLGVDLAQVTASGPRGRILREDVNAYVQTTMRAVPPVAAQPAPMGFTLDLPAWPDLDHGKFGPVEQVRQSRIQKISAGALARNWVTIPHVTNFDKSDITETEVYRKEINADLVAEGVKVTLLSFMMKASVAALKAYPRFNVSFAGDQLVQKRYYHIGFAADTPNGLIVAVVRDCDRKGLVEIAREVAELAAKARDGKLSPAEMTGGCFTVSSLGGIGGTGFTPIINAPEVAILGATRAEIQPVWQDMEFVPRMIQPLALSWDHRAVDGAAAARFLRHISESLRDIRTMLT